MNKNIIKQVSTILFYCFIGILGVSSFASLVIALTTTDNIIYCFKNFSSIWDMSSNWIIVVLVNIALIVFSILVALKSIKATSSNKELKTANTCNIALLIVSLSSFATNLISLCYNLTHEREEENLALYGVFVVLLLITSILYAISLIKPLKEKTNTVINIIALALSLVISLASATLSPLAVILSLFEVLLILCASGNIVLENLDSLKASNN